MAELIKSEGTNTKENAVAAAQKTLERQKKLTEEKRFEFEKFMNALQNVNPELGGFDELGAMLALPEEQFAIIAPVFLDELERGMRTVNDQMLMVQSMNMLGMKVENMREQYEAIYQEIDNQMGDILSRQKRDFLKQMLGMTYNALAEADGVAKKTILIPIEYCREGAKCPTYAHLEDAGMDISYCVGGKGKVRRCGILRGGRDTCRGGFPRGGGQGCRGSRCYLGFGLRQRRTSDAG